MAFNGEIPDQNVIMSKAISSALNRRKIFHFSRVFFELSGFEDGATEKS